VLVPTAQLSNMQAIARAHVNQSALQKIVGDGADRSRSTAKVLKVVRDVECRHISANCVLLPALSP
jgi:hypothetical protein